MLVGSLIDGGIACFSFNNKMGRYDSKQERNSGHR